MVLRHKKEWNFAATWMDSEGIVLSEISQRKTNTLCPLGCMNLFKWVGKDERHSCHKPHLSTVPAVTAE